MFYLYHIKGIKWGCTKRLEQRLKVQGYSISDLDRLITVGNIDKAAELELQLNKEFGYLKHLADYRQTLQCSEKIRNSIHPSKLGKKYGYKNLLNGVTEKSRKKGGEIAGNIVSNRILTCPHCKKEGKWMVMHRWHMDNCKLKTP